MSREYEFDSIPLFSTNIPENHMYEQYLNKEYYSGNGYAINESDYDFPGDSVLQTYVSYIPYLMFNGTFDLNKQGNTTGNLSVEVKSVRQVCGFPAFCHNSAIKGCSNTTILTECSECSVGFAALFVAICIFLGLLILIGNSLVIWSVVTDRKRTKQNKIKASLAFADLFTAITLLVIVIYNFSWTIVSTPTYIEAIHLSLRGSNQAIAGGVFYLLGFTASLYHLVYLGLQRFYAIIKPIKYKNQSSLWFNIGMAMVWVFAITTASMPIWFSEETFVYFSMVFIYLPSAEFSGEGFSKPYSIVTAIIFTVVPYMFMTFISISTAILIHFSFKKSDCVKPDKKSSRKSNEIEISAFKTVALMQFGFSITLAPLVIADILYVFNYFRCDEIAIPFTICIYLSMSNSLVNVLIYSFRDQAFKKKVKAILTSSKLTKVFCRTK